jgi:uncharacterized membrane protein
MRPSDWLGFATWIVVVQFGAALLIAGYAVAAVVALARTREIERARLVLADGVVTGLSLLVVAALLRMILLESWQDIGLFAATFCLRTLLKRLFVWEEARLRQSPARRANAG